MGDGNNQLRAAPPTRNRENSSLGISHYPHFRKGCSSHQNLSQLQSKSDCMKFHLRAGVKPLKPVRNREIVFMVPTGEKSRCGSATVSARTITEDPEDVVRCFTSLMSKQCGRLSSRRNGRRNRRLGAPREEGVWELLLYTLASIDEGTEGRVLTQRSKLSS